MGCGRCGKARQGPSCLPLLGQRVEAVPARAFPPQNAPPMCSRWWCQAREGQARCLAPKSRGQSRDLSSSCCSGCELLPTAAGPGAVTVDAASQLGSHPTAWDWTSSSKDVGDVWPGASLQSQNSPTPPSSLLGWQLDGFFLRLSLGNSQLMLMGAKQTFFKSTSWNKIEDCLCSWDF